MECNLKNVIFWEGKIYRKNCNMLIYMYIHVHIRICMHVFVCIYVYIVCTYCMYICICLMYIVVLKAVTCCPISLLGNNMLGFI